MIKDIKKVQRKLESKFEELVPAIDKAAASLYETNPALAREFLTDFSLEQADITVKRWRELGNFLLVKYLDGNLHPEENGVFKRNAHGHPAHPEFPGYSEKYYKQIVDDTGDKLKMKEYPPKSE
jgi:hypothetical protein